MVWGIVISSPLPRSGKRILRFAQNDSRGRLAGNLPALHFRSDEAGDPTRTAFRGVLLCAAARALHPPSPIVDPYLFSSLSFRGDSSPSNP